MCCLKSRWWLKKKSCNGQNVNPSGFHALVEESDFGIRIAKISAEAEPFEDIHASASQPKADRVVADCYGNIPPGDFCLGVYEGEPSSYKRIQAGTGSQNLFYLAQ